MRSKKSLYIFLSLFLLTNGRNIFPQSLSLEEAIKIAMEKNPMVKRYEEVLEQKKYENLEAWGNFLPSVGIEGGYTHLNDPLSIDLNPIREAIINIQARNQSELTNVYGLIGGQPPLTDAQKNAVYQSAYAQLDAALPQFRETLKEQDYWSASWVGVQPLFMGGKIIAAKRAAGFQKAIAEIELKKIKNETAQSVIEKYLSVILLEEVLNTRREVLSGIKIHERNAIRLNEEGIIANYDVLRAKVAVAEAENNLSDDENQMELALLALKNAMGINEKDTITVEDSLIFSEGLDSLGYYVTVALESQPLLKMIELNKKVAEENYAVERSDFLPQIAAFGKYEMFPQYQSALEPRWAVGVQMKYNLFNGFKDYSKLQTATRLEREVDFIKADAERKVSLWVNKTYREANNSRTKYLNLEANVELAKESLRLNRKRFETGYGTSLEVIDAQLSLEKSKIDRSNTLYEYYKSLADLSVAMGEANIFVTIWNNRSLENE